MLVTRNFRRLDSSRKDRYKVLQDSNRRIEHGAEFLFSSWPDLSILLPRNRVTKPQAVLLAPSFRFGKDGEHSGERAVCCDPPSWSLLLFGWRRAHIRSKTTGSSVPHSEPITPKQQHSPHLRTPLTLCYYIVAEWSILRAVLIKRIV